MAHLFRKYTSNRGSALFMVISTMTALFISCMAMYFSMVSARSSQVAMFNKMQANQTAMSVLQIVRTALSTPSDPLFVEVNKLQVGESITTDSNDFKSLDPGVASELDEFQVGSYAVTITCLERITSGGVTFPKVDIMVITSVDGNRQSVHTTATLGIVANFPGGVDGSGGDAELFAATGYVPNDAYLYSGHFLTDVFYDTQYTYIGTFKSAMELRIAQSVRTGGSMLVSNGAMGLIEHKQDYDDFANSIGPVTWAVRGDLYFNIGNNYPLRDGSKVLVGGDLLKASGDAFFTCPNLTYTGHNTNIKTDDSRHYSIYVNGDFNYSTAKLNDYTWIYVNGNVYGMTPESDDNKNVRLFVTGTDAEREAKVATSNWDGPVYEWKKSGSFADGLTYNEFIKLLDEETATIPYYKWDLSGNTSTTATKHVDINLQPADGENIFIFSYDNDTSSASLLRSNGGAYDGAVGKSFVVDSVNTPSDNLWGQTIIIDTGEDEKNIITIKASKLDADGVFSWFYADGKTQTSMINDRSRLVLLRGKGTVLFDVPPGVTYQDATYQKTIHQSWFLAEAGSQIISTIKADGKEYLDFKTNPQKEQGKVMINYVHKECDWTDPADGCSIHTEDLDPEEVFCDECGSRPEDGMAPMKQVICDEHGEVNVYCPNCYPDVANRKDWCVNRVDTKAYREQVYAHLGENKKYVEDKDGDIIYPNVNYMMVSCDESSDMLFSAMMDGTPITNNSIYGFIYAPYVSFLASNGTIGGFVKIFGGMTVSDYDFNSTHAYISCYPDKMPNELAAMEGGGSMAGGVLQGASKSWKIEFGGIS